MNKRYVVISSNLNHDYLFLMPIVTWAWNKLGWSVILMMPSSHNDAFSLVYKNCIQSNGEVSNTESRNGNTLCFLLPINEYRSETISQISRLYVSDYFKWIEDDAMIMTSDADMLPLSDYWQPKENEITCYGRDLSDKHFPICYISMNKKIWMDVMNLTGDANNDLRRDLATMPKAKSDNFNEWWQVDQDFCTEKLNEQQNIKRIDRGISAQTGYPIGRVDRSAWDKSLKQKERIDAHLFRNGFENENFTRIMHLIINTFNPTQEEIDFLNNYRNQYVKFIQ